MPPPTAPAKPRPLDPFAALLSYLIPGLGQIYQGRVGKGVMFMVCLLGLFFYGMRLGSWKNVYLPDSNVQGNMLFSFKPLGDVENRPHFAGQFFIGMAAWPAILQYSRFDPQQAENKQLLSGWQRQPSDDQLNQLQRDGDKRWDLGWVYTVVAGVLNLLVIYDALAGPAHRELPESVKAKDKVTT
ncbi:MAG: DUF6677 family protein [Gemmataceae bacterium]